MGALAGAAAVPAAESGVDGETACPVLAAGGAV